MRRKALPSVSRFERGTTSIGEIAFRDGHGNAGHFFQVRDHIVEGGRQRADFVVAVNVDVLIEVAGIADFARHGNEMRQRLGDGFGGVEGDAASPDEQSEQRPADRERSVLSVLALCRGIGCFVERLG